MPRNNLKRLPVAVLRRGMAHFHPGMGSPGRAFATDTGDGGTRVTAPGPRPAPVSPTLLMGPWSVEPDASGGPAPAAEPAWADLLDLPAA